MNAPLSKVEQIRARHGDGCWLCGGELDFRAPPNSKKAPTKEHLQPLSLGGTSDLDNLALCHPGCNRQLANRPREDKERMRAKRRAALLKQASQKSPIPPRATPPVPAKRDPAHYWRAIAFGSCLLAAFASGLAIGLLLAS
jgi:hypothetical protein